MKWRLPQQSRPRRKNHQWESPGRSRYWFLLRGPAKFFNYDIREIEDCTRTRRKNPKCETAGRLTHLFHFQVPATSSNCEMEKSKIAPVPAERMINENCPGGAGTDFFLEAPLHPLITKWGNQWLIQMSPSKEPCMQNKTCMVTLLFLKTLLIRVVFSHFLKLWTIPKCFELRMIASRCRSVKRYFSRDIS